MDTHRIPINYLRNITKRSDLHHKYVLLVIDITHLYSLVTFSSLEKDAFVFAASLCRSASLVAAVCSSASLGLVSSSCEI